MTRIVPQVKTSEQTLRDETAIRAKPEWAIECLPFQLSFQLADGTIAQFRRVAPGDRELLRRGFALLSPQSRYWRLFSYVPALSEDQLRYFTEVDQIDHVAWLATSTGPLAGSALGVARFVRMPGEPTVAEAAFVVADPAQAQGIGTALLAVLCFVARLRDIRILRTVCLAENQRVVNWFRRLGAQVRRRVGECVELDLPVARNPAPACLRH